MSTVWNDSRFGAMLGRTMMGVALVVVVACGKGDRGGTAGGDAGATEIAALDYEVTPDRYMRWVGAQQALDAIPGLPAPPKIDPVRLDEDAIRRAVEYLEEDPRARAALARAGISARDYVLTTVALDQALVAAASSPPEASGASAPGAPAAPAATSGSRSTPSRGARPRVTGAPPRNVELVRRNRDDVVRVLRTMRFRISESAAAEITDTAITRRDSVTVGKDLTVKWDVTVRRNRDTTKGRDSTRPDSTERD